MLEDFSNDLRMDKICGNCGAWEGDPFEKGWIGNCPFEQCLCAFAKECESGRWIPKYDRKAIKWHYFYANKGNVVSQYCLGIMYEEGKSVPLDIELAYMWFKLASSNGHADAVKKTQELENKMSPLQIERAQRLEKFWKPYE